MEHNILVEHLKEKFGFSNFKGNQEAIIENLLEGRDTFVLMPTGGGKSLCYQLPALIMDGVAIIVSPLIALMKNQVDAMRAFSMEDGIAHFINSSLNKATVTKVREDVLAGKTKLLYFAPESLTKEENIKLLQNIKISFYAIDEAHCISEWGHDFRPEYRRIRPIISEIAPAPIIALTATATPKVQMDIQKNLEMTEATVFRSSFNRKNLYYEIRPKNQPDKEIVKFIKSHEGKSGIIYCLSRKKVEEIADLLNINGIKALPYHAGIDASIRVANQDKFIHEDVNVIVATIAFGMGIDKPDVRYVIHYDMPKSLEGYYQETGRAGRDGGEGICLTFYSYKDIQKLEKFIQGKPLAEQEIGRMLIDETVAFAELSTCRRKSLLHYFGEDSESDYCGACDNCINPKELFEAKESVVTALKALRDVGPRFKVDHIVNVLLGRINPTTKASKHDELEWFGIGKDKDDKFWNMVIRNAILEGLIYKSIENYGVLSITEKGINYIDKPFSIMMSKDNEYPDEIDTESIMPRGGGAADNVLLAMLKDLLRSEAKKNNLPPFVIFQEPSLEDMATQYPITLEEMSNITGVGVGKANKFAKPFIELIAKYVEENEINRPKDIIVKSVVNKSQNKVHIIKNIDRKMDLQDIADGRGIEFEDLLTEIETIVNSGTMLNINYYLNEVIDEDKISDIYEYFNEEAESDSIEEAMSELGGDYSEEEVRLVRIKYLSEIGN